MATYKFAIHHDNSINDATLNFAIASLNNIEYEITTDSIPKVPKTQTHDYIIHLYSEDSLYPDGNKIIEDLLEYNIDKVYISYPDLLMHKSFNVINSGRQNYQQEIVMKHNYMLQTNNEFEHNKSPNTSKLYLLAEKSNPSDNKETSIICNSSCIILCQENNQRQLRLPTVDFNNLPANVRVVGHSETCSLVNKIQHIQKKVLFHLIKQRCDHGYDLFKKGDIEGSRNIYMQLIDDDIKYDLVYMRLGGCGYAEKDYDLAIFWWDHVQHKSPGLYKNLGIVYTNLKNYKKANEYFEKCVKSIPAIQFVIDSNKAQMSSSN